ncbi:hypothetical protein SARC_03158 [Sphaeroforma arctica JP610]|uniref:Uncharacterized protein n=1 Tax=Sphaeroforma arctica JP610 TaxID=667725 RepID=A0A0L0G8S5_9EUKA|nr:hypothetical protein SARC_03158 [Sphaeroforma arctica JP610]KNC84628.1 hypothetical protein SARC_03158 [Sphaeroforma arctica JP610]|eukprot:XP_014158530.1 hypothetical protein SARC_03158 [Sphaeroforma arctica JP610]
MNSHPTSSDSASQASLPRQKKKNAAESNSEPPSYCSKVGKTAKPSPKKRPTARTSQPLLQPPVPTHLLTKVMGRAMPDKTLHEMDDITSGMGAALFVQISAAGTPEYEEEERVIAECNEYRAGLGALLDGGMNDQFFDADKVTVVDESEVSPSELAPYPKVLHNHFFLCSQ